MTFYVFLRRCTRFLEHCYCVIWPNDHHSSELTSLQTKALSTLETIVAEFGGDNTATIAYSRRRRFR